MATEFVMPKLGLTMEEGTIVEWLVTEGTEVSKGDAVLRIQTDKVDSDVESPTDGVLHPVGDVGDSFECGEVIGWFLADGETPPAAAAKTTDAAKPTAPTHMAAASATPRATVVDGRIIASPNARRMAAELDVPLAAIVGTGPGGRIVSEDITEAAARGPVVLPAAAASGVRFDAPATFAARQLADLVGIDIGTVAPDGRDGRITRDGVAVHVRSLLAAAASAPALAPAVAAAPAPKPLAPFSQEPTEIIPLKGMRGTIASRMHESLTDMAQLTLFMDASLDAVVADRAARKETGKPPSFTDYVIAAAAKALRSHPTANSMISDAGVGLLPEIHVGMAVAVDGGLMVPVIKNTLSHTLETLSVETTRLAEAARSGGLKLDELEGGTFSVSTLGMFGVDGFTPVINPPNAAILGVGRLRDELVLVDGEVSTTKTMTLSLTWDHRVFDGAPAAEFCKTIADNLLDPAGLDATN